MSDKEYSDTLEHYMKLVLELQEENKELREIIKRLNWSLQEHD